MSFKTDNFGRLIHDATGIVVGSKDGRGIEVFNSVLLAQAAISTPVTGSVAETELAAITVPGGLMGKNGVLRITTAWNLNANSANSKTARLYFGGTLMLAVDMANQSGLHHQMIIRNRGAANSQLRSNSLATSFGFIGHTANAVDTAVDQVISLRGQLANAGDSITLEGFLVEVLPG